MSHPRGLNFGPFPLRVAPFGSVWLRFGSVSGPFRGVGWGRGGVGERGFCKGKEYHYSRIKLSIAQESSGVSEVQGRKCAINNFWTRISAGRLG